MSDPNKAASGGCLPGLLVGFVLPMLATIAWLYDGWVDAVCIVAIIVSVGYLIETFSKPDE